MNCREALPLLPGYLVNEVTPSEKKLIQAHLADCAGCRKELSALAALRGRIKASLQDQAAGAVPSPRAWSRLQARLQMEAPARPDRSARHSPWFRQGVFTMKHAAFTLVAILALVVGTLAFVPDVRAAALETVIGWLGYDFPSPNSEDIVSWGTIWGFTPYSPRYMPEGLQLKGSMVGGDTTTEEVGLCYQPEERKQGDPFIVVRETHLAAQGDLPAGKAVRFNGGDGVVDELPAGQIEWCLGPSPVEESVARPPARSEAGSLPQLPPDEPLRYERALRLTFFIDDIQVEIFGPYPEKELMRIAKSLVPVQPSEEQPEQPARP